MSKFGYILIQETNNLQKDKILGRYLETLTLVIVKTFFSAEE